MKTYRIECNSHSREIRSWEVTPEGRVWPCCFFGNGWDKRHRKEATTKLNPEGIDTEYKTLISDPHFNQLMKDDPNWNSLEHHTLDEITQHEYFWSTVWYPGWESDNPHPTCALECSVQINSLTGEETSASNINIKAANKKGNFS